MPSNDVLDEHLLVHVSDVSRKMNYVAANALFSLREAGHQDVTDMLLLDRLRALIADGRIQALGNPARNHFCEVLLPSIPTGSKVD